MKIADKKFSNKEIAHLLRSVAAAYVIKNGERFKIAAYYNAADNIERLTREIKDVWENKQLKEISGIGSSIYSYLDEYFRTGQSSHFKKIFQGIPATVFELLRVSTLGPKRAYKLVKALKLNNVKTAIKDLEEYCLNGKVAAIDGFGEKSAQEILSAIRFYQKQSLKKERMPLPYAFNIASELTAYLKKHSLVDQVDVLGSLRRMVATVGDIDISVKIKKQPLKSETFKEIINYFIKFPKVIKVINAGEKKASIIVRPNIQVDLRVQEPESYGSMLQYFTGSKNHNIKLREFALKKGLSLSEYGIRKLKVKSLKFKVAAQSSKLYKFEQERDFYNFLGLQYIPPEIREGTNEIELAEKNKLPHLVELEDLKGDLHIHSSYDLRPAHDLGEDSIEKNIQAAKNLGYQYIGFADHNPSISAQSEQTIISLLKARNHFFDKLISLKKIDRSDFFIGLEVDILPNGQLAIPEKAINYLDYLIVSVHSSFSLNRQKMTKRVLTGMSYPKVKILAHPTGRLLNKRQGFELDWDKIFSFCREKKIVLEINSYPNRLDLPDILVRKAISAGVKLVINSDAHNVNQMKTNFYGVSVARRGWAKKDDIINTLTYKKIKKWLLD